MDLKSGYPFWLVKNGLIRSYPALDRNLSTEVVVIGGGITGALIAHELTRSGIETVVLDRRDIGWGSSSASTALLQYEIDTPLTELTSLWNEEEAVRSYRVCLEAIGKVESLCDELGLGDEYQSMPSFYFASKDGDLGDLRAEFDLRLKHGFPVEWWDREQIRKNFDFEAPAGIMSRVSGQTDVYRLTHALHGAAMERGLRVFDRTAADKVEVTADGVEIRTNTECVVRAKHVIVAAGYESQKFLPQNIVRLTSTFAVASEPLTNFDGWYERCLLWESARPYLYARTTGDDRVIFGGEDVAFQNEAARDALLPKKVDRLVDRMQSLFPRLPIQPAFYWAGTFAETPDGLPFIGTDSERPRLHFAMCYGGNGITYSVAASEILRDAVRGEVHRDAHLFRFDRPSLPARVRAKAP